MANDHVRTYYYLKDGVLVKALSMDVPLDEGLVVYSSLSGNFFIYQSKWGCLSEDHPKAIDLKAYLLIEGILNA